MALIFLKNTRRLRMKSFTKDDWYELDLDLGTCSCKNFEKKAECKHLQEITIYRKKDFTPKTHPSFSQALCALVKSIRLRNVEEAVYWMVYMDTFTDLACRFRMARRILIGSAEDGFSIPVMEKCVENFPKMMKKDTPLLYLVAEVARICKLPNWWSTDTGHQFVHDSLVGGRRFVEMKYDHKEETLKQIISSAIDCQDVELAVAGVNEFWNLKTPASATKIAEFLLEQATERKNEWAQRLCKIHFAQRGPLSGDNNFLGQAAWQMAVSTNPFVEEIYPVFTGECVELIKQAQEQWKTPHPVPTWACDGIHCAGNDTRFMGMLPEMMAVCNAYKHYGDMSPSLKWLPEFVCYDGLEIEWVQK